MRLSKANKANQLKREGYKLIYARLLKPYKYVKHKEMLKTK